MKNINDLMQLTAEIFETKGKSHKFFIQTYGHVQKIEITYYKNGWDKMNPDIKPIEKSAYFDQPEQVELLYWWTKILLKSNDYE
jgi:hypothetical protein